MFCSADLNGVSDFIAIPRGAILWADDTVDLLAVTRQIEADYAAKHGWSVTRSEEGHYAGQDINTYSPERYSFDVSIDTETGYFAIGAWSPCFPKPPDHSGIDRY